MMLHAGVYVLSARRHYVSLFFNGQVMRRNVLCFVLALASPAVAADLFNSTVQLDGPEQVRACAGLVQVLATRSPEATASGWTITAPRIQFIARTKGDKTGIAFAAPGYPTVVNISYVEVVDGAILFHQHDVNVVGGSLPPPTVPPVDPPPGNPAPVEPPPVEPPPPDDLAAIRNAVAAAVRGVDAAYQAPAPKIAANIFSVLTKITERKITDPEVAIQEIRSLNRSVYRTFKERAAWDAVFVVVENSLRDAGFKVFNTASEMVLPLEAVARGIREGAN